MIHYKMYFSPYDWEIEVYVVLKQCFINTIIESLKDCTQSEIQQAFLNLTTRINSGFIKTFNNFIQFGFRALNNTYTFFSSCITFN